MNSVSRYRICVNIGAGAHIEIIFSRFIDRHNVYHNVISPYIIKVLLSYVRTQIAEKCAV